MAGKIGRFAKALRLDEPVIRLAEYLADRYDVTVQELIEALLLSCDQGNDAEIDAPPPMAEPEPLPRRRGGRPCHVIDLAEARRRRGTEEPGRRAQEISARATTLVERSQVVRARATALCEQAARVRREAAAARVWSHDLPRLTAR